MDRYLLRNAALPFAAILGVLIALFAGFSLAGILADAVAGLLPVRVIAALAVLKVLISLDVLIPISLFIAVVMAFGRLQADSEVTAMQALGMSPFRLLRPILALALAMACCVACLSLFIRPLAYAQSHAISRRASVMLNVNAMQAGTFYSSNDGGQVIFMGGKDGRVAGQGVFVAREAGGHVEVIYAQSAQPAVVDSSGQRVVHLNGSNIYRFDLNDASNDQVVAAAGMNVNPDNALPSPPGYSPVAASSRHLAQSSRKPDIAELQWRFSTGISTLLLALLGFALSRGKPRQNRFARFGPAIFAYSVYYLLCTLARTWVQHGEVGRFPGLWWAPAGLALILAAWWGMPALRSRFGGIFPHMSRLRLTPPARPAGSRDAA